MASVPTGTKLGKYEVVKPLVSGGMAELLLARTDPAERPLVLKWIRPEHAIDSEFIDAFASEGRRAAQLHHPNIVEVHEVGREDGTHYLAMEYVHGDDLRKLLARLHERRAKLPVQHVLAIATGVAHAVHHAHEQFPGDPVLHLGIKPGNVIITADGVVKLADFGIGRAALTEGRTDLLASVVGYLSPEQCIGKPADRRSDIFGIGILMYELCIGRRLFKADNEFVTMATIVAGDVPTPTKLRGDLPKELEAIILKALSPSPDDRYQTAQELITALEKFATKAGVRGSPTTLSGYTKRLFGARPEPWLVDEEVVEPSGREFDTAPKGIATPPDGALKGNYPDDSPIVRIRKRVSRDQPTEQLDLGNLKSESVPVKIPTSNGNGAKKASRNTPAPVPAPPRNKPKTVQIPAAAVVDTGATKLMVQPDKSPEVITPTVVDRVAERAKTTPRSIDDDAPDTITEQIKPPVVSTVAKVAPPPFKKPPPKPDASVNEPISGEIEDRATTVDRKGTDVDEIAIESTAVANPPPMPVRKRGDVTEAVAPLSVDRITTTDQIVASSLRRKRMIILGIGLVAAVLVFVALKTFGSDDEQDETRADVSAARVEPKDEAKTDVKTDEAKTEDLRTASTPRTPRNSHVTTDDEPKTDEPRPPPPADPIPEPRVEPPKVEAKVEPPKVEAKVEPKVEPPKVEAKVEPPKVEPPKVEPKVEPPKVEPKVEPPKVEAKVEPPKVEAKKPVKDPPPPKFVEPKDPAPPDEPVATKKPTTKPTKPPITKPTKPPTTKTTAKTSTKTTKPTGKWDPTSLFPQK